LTQEDVPILPHLPFFLLFLNDVSFNVNGVLAFALIARLLVNALGQAADAVAVRPW